MPLQKSFSEQNHSAKSKQQWSRRRSVFKRQHVNAHSKSLREKTPLPVSTATKNKLHDFHLDAHVNTQSKKNFNWLNDEKENGDFLKEKTQFIEECRLQDNNKEAQSASNKLMTDNIPLTPVNKLALPELIGMRDVIKMRQEISPEEKIEWDHNKGEFNQFSITFSAARTSGKRARSSSPIISSPMQAPVQFDPGTELWGRYSHRGSKLSKSQDQSELSFAHMMCKYSPKPVHERITPRSVGEFRRANSCGNYFPKRKKYSGIDYNDGTTESTITGSSKLSILIERVKEGLINLKSPYKAQMKPLDSDRYLEHTEISKSNVVPYNHPEPKRDLQKLEALPEDTVEKVQMGNNNYAQDVLSGRSKTTDYDEFDDEEFDSSLYNVSTSNCKVNIQKSLESTYSHAIKSPDGRLSESKNSSTFQKKKDLQNSQPIGKDKISEFEDFEDELLSIDLELLVSQYDVQPEKEVKTSTKNDNMAQSNKKVEMEPEDEFDDGIDDEDFKAAEASTLQIPNSLTTPRQENIPILRYLVTNILSSSYETPLGRKIEKILSLRAEYTKKVKFVHLRSFWIETPVTVDAFVHIIGSFNLNGQCIVDEDKNYLILYPDHLISSTVVADSFTCVRRAILQDRIKSTSQPNASLVYGILLHEIFQAALISNRWDSEWLTEVIKSISAKHIEDLYIIKIQLPEAIRHLQSKIVELQSWASIFICSNPKPEAVIKSLDGQVSTMCINKLLDVEEHIWSPTYGLKGNIDATVQVSVKDKNHQRTLTVPLEFKTGKNISVSHRAQTALYCLLLSDRYDIKIDFGVLYYLETSKTKQIPAIRHELCHMIIQRNKLACFIHERSSKLPPMLKKEYMCDKCYAKVPCFIYHRFADDGTGETSGLESKFENLVKHLTSEHKKFFLFWDDLLTKEEKENYKFRRELWTMLSTERERLGRCFSNVIIKPGSSKEFHENNKVARYQYVMIKQNSSPDFSFLDSQITSGEPIVISDEEGHFALANGYVTQAWKDRVTVQVDRRLHENQIRQSGFDEINNQVFAGIMEVTSERKDLGESDSKKIVPTIKYRLDKDEFSNGMATVRNNLIQVMANSSFGSQKIRGLIVDLTKPRFKSQSDFQIYHKYPCINDDQRRAVEKVLSAEDYALVLGMPGTGKTTTIVYMIRALISLGKSILLTSYTHTAVDNILLKLKTDCIPILRLGQPSKISPEVQDFVISSAKSKNSFQEIRSDWLDTPIVAVTCLGINHRIFDERVFDYCIVDEASQITLPVCLGPIRLAQTFILVGDHCQLPPLVQNEEARRGGMDLSLFKHLSEKHPDSVVYLEHQYRMCEDIMKLSNNLIYHGRLKCGSHAVACHEILIPNIDNLKNHHILPSTSLCSKKKICLGTAGRKCWLRDSIDPSIKVSFLNTDTLLPLAREEAKGNRIVNPTEAKICSQLVNALLSTGVPASSIGVMTHYRSQLALLKYHLRAHNVVEMHTADRFQGRDKEVIILSLVRSNSSRSIGELLKDWRRVNVAFTRAKAKLLVIGSRETLKGNGSGADNEEEMVAQFVKLMEINNWIYDLPSEAVEDHFFEDVDKVTGNSGETSRQNSMETNSLNSGHEWYASRIDVESREGQAKIQGDKYINKSFEKFKNCIMQPKRRKIGVKPFKIPQQGILTDVINEMVG